YKLLEEAWNFTVETLAPLGMAFQANKTDRQIKLGTGGKMDFWTLQSSTPTKTSVGRGRKYKRVVVDEAAHAPYLEQDWTKSIRPTLADLRGDAWFPSSPWGHNYFWRLWCTGQAGDPNWASFQMPTSGNPYILDSEIEAARLDPNMPADAFSQEYLAEFLADVANPFGVDAIHACECEGFVDGPVAYWGFDLAKSVDHTVGIGLNQAGHVCAFQRWQSDWHNTQVRIAAMIGQTPALIDSTGVGDPIVEELCRLCSLAEGYLFTSRSKQQLMEGLAVVIQRGLISYPSSLDVLIHELESFQYEYHANGVRYTAPQGMHDDCVDAIALAVRCKTLAPAAPTFSGPEDRPDPMSLQEVLTSDEGWT
ncbi:hypothetical protein LCGC14_2694360, partial [marine sediment metagenome]